VSDTKKAIELDFMDGYTLHSSEQMVPESKALSNFPAVPTQYIFNWGLWCAVNQQDCGFSNLDTLYSWVATVYYLGDNDVYVVVGVNHVDAGMATYMSVGQYNAEQSYSLIDYFTNVELPPVGDCTSVFVLGLGKNDNCPEDFTEDFGDCFDENDVPANEPFVFFSRATLNPNSKTHPDPHEVILPYVMHFVRSPPD